jgi:hypothetical protein
MRFEALFTLNFPEGQHVKTCLTGLSRFIGKFDNVQRTETVTLKATHTKFHHSPFIFFQSPPFHQDFTVSEIPANQR